MVNNKTLACPTIDQLSKAPVDNDSLNLSMYAIANNCVILGHGDKISAVGYDPRNTKEIFQQVLVEKTGQKLFVKRSAITIEQGGKKNIMRF